MSYTFLQEQGAVSSAESFSDIPAYVLSRLNLTAEKSCCNGNATESCQSSPYGMMLKPLTESRGEGKLMSCAEDSRVKTSVEPAQEQDGKELTGSEVDYGAKCPESFARLDRDSCSWKTAQCSLFGGLEGFSENWPRWGLMLDGACFPLPMLEHDISERGYGYWPTPLKTDTFPFAPDTMMRQERGENRKSGCHIGTSLKWDRRVQPYLDVGHIPTWLHEWLMIWPLGWTALKPLATAKFQQWLNSHGKS